MYKILGSLALLLIAQAGYSKANPDSASFYFSKAQQLQGQRKHWEADKLFEKALIFDENNPHIRLHYADFLTEQRKYYPAIQQLEKVLASDANNSKAVDGLMNIYFSLGRWNDVLTLVQKIDLDKAKAKTRFMAGKSFFYTENYGKAQRYLTEAIAADPTITEAYTVLGRVLIELDDFAKAAEVYQQAVNNDPKNVQLIYELGLLQYRLNNKQEAVKNFELAAEKGYKKDLVYYENLGLAYLNFDIDKGVAALQKVLEMKPNNAEIQYQMAQGYLGAKRFNDAAAVYQKVFEANPRNSKALYMAGVAFIKAGDKLRGEDYCERAIKMDPMLAKFKEEVPSQ